MGYGVYEREGRWQGYGVPAICDHEGCGESIDRGMGYMCGEELGAEKGCGLFFCSDHLWIGGTDNDPQMCQRCCDDEPPFGRTPDTPEWVAHMLVDESWQQWRDENHGQVAAMTTTPDPTSEESDA